MFILAATNVVENVQTTITKASDLITATNALILALIIFVAYMRSFRNAIKPYTTITDDIKNLSLSVSNISKELKPNGGSSLKDQVTDLHKSTKIILNRQRWILENREEPIFETDEHGNFKWVNEAFIRLTDKLFKDLENNNWINAICEKMRNEIDNEWKTAIRNKRNFEHQIIIVDSKDRSFSAKCIAIRQDDDKYIGKLVNVCEIPEDEKTC
jgi:PAS domain-containing protein